MRKNEMGENKHISLFNVVNKEHGNVIAGICLSASESILVFTPRENTMSFVAAYLDEVNRTTDN